MAGIFLIKRLTEATPRLITFIGQDAMKDIAVDGHNNPEHQIVTAFLVYKGDLSASRVDTKLRR